jgi:hypothetical protein
MPQQRPLRLEEMKIEAKRDAGRAGLPVEVMRADDERTWAVI